MSLANFLRTVKKTTMWKWAVIEVVKVWLLGQLPRKYDSEHRCRGHGYSEERETESVLRLCWAQSVGRIGEGSPRRLAL